MIDLNLPQKIRNFVENQFPYYRESAGEYSVYCPFHHNTDTPALYINKITGLWICFNPSCGEKGNINKLANYFGTVIAQKIVAKDFTTDELITSLNSINNSQSTMFNWDEALERVSIDYNNIEQVKNIQYLLNRGFDKDILEYFEIGFSERQQRIVIPARDEAFRIIGFIGRAISEDQNPRYRYSDNFPKASLLFNLNNAKFSPEVFVTEGSLDAIKVHQAGYHNVVATLGSNVNRRQIDLLNKYFDSVTILSDNDDAGFAMRNLIVDGCSTKNLYVVEYPSGIKDPGEMSTEQITDCIRNRKGYLDWLFSPF